MLESYHKSQRKPKTVFEFKDAPQLTRSALREKAMDAGVKDYGRWLHACVSANVDILDILCGNSYYIY